MSAAKKKPDTPELDDTGPVAKASLSVGLIVALVNTVVVLGGVGTLTFTKLLYKRPKITEESERARIEKLKASKPKVTELPGSISLERVTVNIQATPGQPKPADGTANQIEGKLHYVTLNLTLEVRDMNRKDEIESIRPLIMDRLLLLLGRKNFQELSTVQGRYILRTQIIDYVNQTLAERAAKKETPIMPGGLVSNAFFTDFFVQ